MNYKSAKRFHLIPVKDTVVGGTGYDAAWEAAFKSSFAPGIALTYSP